MYFRYVSPNLTYDDVKNKPIRLPGLKPGDMRRANTERHEPSKKSWWKRTYHRSERRPPPRTREASLPGVRLY